ncbi:unnamed protein product [Amoebophrya sp. A25]|nr:unnamed protein product [Amoebophrya sp. A25]|eukprot:GSA25T00000631001.1
MEDFRFTCATSADMRKLVSLIDTDKDNILSEQDLKKWLLTRREKKNSMFIWKALRFQLLRFYSRRYRFIQKLIYRFLRCCADHRYPIGVTQLALHLLYNTSMRSIW